MLIHASVCVSLQSWHVKVQAPPTTSEESQGRRSVTVGQSTAASACVLIFPSSLGESDAMPLEERTDSRPRLFPHLHQYADQLQDRPGRWWRSFRLL